MEVRRSVNTRFWADTFIEDLDPKEKLLFLYLLTNEKTNMLGCYEISKKRISYETGITAEDIDKAFEGFERLRKAYFFDGFVFLPNWIKNQSMNKNMLTSAKNDYMSLSNSLKLRLKENGFEGFGRVSKGSEGFGRVSNDLESVSNDSPENNEENLTLPNDSLILPKKEKEKEKEDEKEDENEKDISNLFSETEKFLTDNKIKNFETLEFLSSPAWFESKSMQLRIPHEESLMSYATDFLIDIRDRDLLEGKELIGLRSYFISWVKMKRSKEAAKSTETYFIPNPNR